MDDAIAAYRGQTPVEAAVGVDLIGVVAVLAGLGKTIATTGAGTGRRTPIGIEFIPVVALFDADLNNAITTTGDLTG